MTPTLAFIIVNYNTRELLAACLGSIYRHTRGVSFEVVVVDNGSSDGSQAMVQQQYADVVLIESGGNIGFGRANNLGFVRSRAPYVMLLNSDALLLEDTGAALVRFLQATPKAGIVGPDVHLLDGTRQPKTRGMLPTARVMLNQNLLLCRLFPRSRFFAGLYVETDWARENRVGWISGVCMVLRREVYEQCGGFDPEIFMYAEDVDLCRRCATLGWETWRISAHAIKHLCGGSTKTEAHVLRNRVLQQRNFIHLIDGSMSPVGRWLTRASFVAGLTVRAVLRGCTSVAGGAGRRLAFRADLHCLADLVGLTKTLPGDTYAHRA
jgi:N-acetylglucosaminyl-diphospho-decaprenol L-rhamnosyltransferase